MYFESVEAMFNMDGHGGFVWAAYCITVVVIVLLLRAPRQRQQRFLQQKTGELKRQQGAPGVEEKQ